MPVLVDQGHRLARVSSIGNAPSSARGSPKLPDETPSGVLARFKFRVADGRFGEPRAEEGAFPIELTRAAVTHETEITPAPGLRRFEQSGIEAVLGGAVVVRVEDP